MLIFKVRSKYPWQNKHILWKKSNEIWRRMHSKEQLELMSIHMPTLLSFRFYLNCFEAWPLLDPEQIWVVEMGLAGVEDKFPSLLHKATYLLSTFSPFLGMFKHIQTDYRHSILGKVFVHSQIMKSPKVDSMW